MSFQTCETFAHLQNTKIYLMKSESFWPSTDSNGTTTFKAQKGSKDIVKGVIGCKTHFYMLFEHKCVLAVCVHNRGVTIRVSCIERFTGSSKWKWSSLSPWSGDFGVNRAPKPWDVPVTMQHGVSQQMSLFKCQMSFYFCYHNCCK